MGYGRTQAKGTKDLDQLYKGPGLGAEVLRKALGDALLHLLVAYVRGCLAGLPLFPDLAIGAQPWG